MDQYDEPVPNRVATIWGEWARMLLRARTLWGEWEDLLYISVFSGGSCSCKIQSSWCECQGRCRGSKALRWILLERRNLNCKHLDSLSVLQGCLLPPLHWENYKYFMNLANILIKITRLSNKKNTFYSSLLARNMHCIKSQENSDKVFIIISPSWSIVMYCDILYFIRALLSQP